MTNPNLPALMDEIERLHEGATKVEPVPRLRTGSDGFERYDLVGVPCGFPVGTFGDANDAALDLAFRNHWPAFRDYVRALEGALEQCRDKFREYERLHLAKVRPVTITGKELAPNTEAVAKARANAAMAEMCEAALITKDPDNG